jgi:hypothetical protein
MVQCRLPGLHELLIMLRCECSYQFIACPTKAGVCVSDVGDAPCAFFTELNIQPARRDAGRNLQHLDKKLLWLVTRDIPNCAAPLVRRDKDTVTLRNATGTDDEVRRPSVRPFCFPHGAKEREDLLWRGTQSQPVCMCCSIWFGDVHKRPNDPSSATRRNGTPRFQPQRSRRVRYSAWLGLVVTLDGQGATKRSTTFAFTASQHSGDTPSVHTTTRTKPWR